MRVTNASSRIATAMPNPNCSIAAPGWNTYEAKTNTMISAAAITMRPPPPMPARTASVASAPSSRSSCMRETR